MSEERQLLRRQLRAAGWRGKKARRKGRNAAALQEVVTVRAVQRLRRMTPEQVSDAHEQVQEVRRSRSWWRRLFRWLVNW